MTAHRAGPAERPRVDYYLGHPDGSAGEAKWFSCWYERLRGRIDSQRLHVRERFVPRRWSLGARLNLALQTSALARVRRPGSLLHIPSQLLSSLAARGAPGGGPLVITCHDVIPYLPECFELSGERYPRASIEAQLRALHAAQAVLADSACSRREAIERLGLDPGRVHLVHLGVDAEHYRPRARTSEVATRHGFIPDAATLLFVGTEAPRKNLEGIARAMAILKGRNRRVRLVKVGRSGPWGGGFRERVRELGLASDIVAHERVSEDQLPHLYSAADAFVFPSFYEGFGMPVLEAMASGCPVVTSTASSLPEVAGDAALLVDPSSPEAIAGAIERILDSEDVRRELRRKGLERAGAFPWEATAERTLEIYRSLA